MNDDKQNPTTFQNVHQIMQDASLISKNKKESMVPMSTKVPESDKALAEKICYNNGTTLSEFVRQCLKTLIKEYKS